MLKLLPVKEVEMGMLRVMIFSAAVFASSHVQGADCLALVELGEPGFQVIEKCGEPLRREREERRRSVRCRVRCVRYCESSRQRLYY